MDIELRHLRVFAAVATSRSFSRAAEQLFITQPTLTRTVRQIAVCATGARTVGQKLGGRRHRPPAPCRHRNRPHYPSLSNFPQACYSL